MRKSDLEPEFSEYLLDLAGSVAGALREDIRTGDVTAMLINADTMAEAAVITREAGVICGRPWFDEVFRQLDSEICVDWQVAEGERVEPNQTLVKLEGIARSLLTGERTALNFLQTLSATATSARRYSEAVKDSKIQVLDTRKTIPGLRLAQKYAVLIGGCQNHRIGLYDAFLIKENHILACGSISAAVAKAKTVRPDLPVEVETENLTEVVEALNAKADRIMLDNFGAAELKQAVELISGAAEIEISGNIDLDQLNDITFEGVDFISSGALTKHIRAMDLSMRVQFIS